MKIKIATKKRNLKKKYLLLITNILDFIRLCVDAILQWVEETKKKNQSINSIDDKLIQINNPRV